MGWLRQFAGRARGGKQQSKLEQAPEAKKRTRLLDRKRPSEEDVTSARVVVSRSIARAGRRYATGMRKPIASNGREKALGEARSLVVMATELAEQFGFVDEIVNAPGITALRAKLFPQGKPPPCPPQTSSKRGGKTSDPDKRRRRGWGPGPVGRIIMPSGDSYPVTEVQQTVESVTVTQQST